MNWNPGTTFTDSEAGFPFPAGLGDRVDADGLGRRVLRRLLRGARARRRASHGRLPHNALGPRCHG